MSAVASPSEVMVVLKSRELRRELKLDRNKYGQMWLGIYPDGSPKHRRPCVAFCGGVPADFSIREFTRDSLAGQISLVVGTVQFPITRAEADRLVAEFGFEVRKQ